MPAKGSGFEFFTGDVNYLDYGGVWARHIGGREYHFIELTNMDEACGRDSAGRPRYGVELSAVDLDDIPEDVQVSAVRSCGCPLETISPDAREAALAEMCRSYGARAPLHSVETNNAWAGIAECRKESYRLTRDPNAMEDAMDNHPVNRIGSTAREFMRGDITSAVVRGCAAGNPDAAIMAKMYVAADGQTLGGRLPRAEVVQMTEALVKGAPHGKQ